MPAEPSTTMVLIGPGTGITPFPQLLTHHIEELQTASASTHANVIPQDEVARVSTSKCICDCYVCYVHVCGCVCV